MKFASLKSIYVKFFHITQAGTQSRSDWWARERLSHLKRHGYLNVSKVSFSGSSFYLATDLAHTALTNLTTAVSSHMTDGSRPINDFAKGRSFVRPIERIDIRTFEHDRLVMEARLALEGEGRATDWLSERRLKSETSLAFGLAREFQPDAIYRNRLGESVAFELEIAVKSRDRYQDKIRKYVEVMRENESQVHGEHHSRKRDQGLRGVLFVTVHESVFKILTELTEKYGGKFRIERLEELLMKNVSSLNGVSGGIDTGRHLSTTTEGVV